MAPPGSCRWSISSAAVPSSWLASRPRMARMAAVTGAASSTAMVMRLPFSEPPCLAPVMEVAAGLAPVMEVAAGLAPVMELGLMGVTWDRFKKTVSPK